MHAQGRSRWLDWRYFLNLWWTEHHTYFAGYRPDQCRNLLADGTTLWLGAPVGRAWFSLADISLYRVTLWTNSFRPYAHVKFREAPGGTSVDARLSSPLGIKVFGTFWLGLALVWTVIVEGGILASHDWSGIPLGLAGIGMCLFFLGLLAVTRAMAIGDGDFLLRYISERLGAKEEAPGSPP